MSCTDLISAAFHNKFLMRRVRLTKTKKQRGRIPTTLYNIKHTIPVCVFGNKRL